MLRSTLILAGAALLCSAASAQSQIDPSRIYPITVPIKHAGTYHVATGTWSPPSGGLAAGNTIIYNNTCTWTGGNFYGGLEACEDLYDEGRVPSTGDPSAPPGAANSNTVLSFEIGYCTQNANNFPLTVAFWNNLNGNCVGGVPPTPPPIASQATAFYDLSSAGLPGSTTTGFQGCWLVNIDLGGAGQPASFNLLSDGDGIFDNNQASDNFTWSWSHENPTHASGADGHIISGDPNAVPAGACSYNIPCGTDPFTAANCGTGLGANDNFWINVDNVAVGNTTSGQCLGGVAPFGGTNCYFFGGYPTNPFASNYLTLTANAGGGCPAPSTYCTAKTTSNNCVPSIGATGTPSPSGNFVLTGTQIEGASIGVAFYSLGGPNAQPFQGGFLCILPPVVRLPPQPSGGTFGTCTGNFSTPLTNLINTLNVGQNVWIQYWFRDNGAASGTGLSNALTFVRCP